MLDPREEAVVIASSHLRVASAVVSLRLGDPAAEERRLALMDELLRATGHLSRALADLALHGLSDSRGTHSAWDVGADADRVFEALVRYEALIHGIGSEYELLIVAAERQRASEAAGGRSTESD